MIEKYNIKFNLLNTSEVKTIIKLMLPPPFKVFKIEKRGDLYICRIRKPTVNRDYMYYLVVGSNIENVIAYRSETICELNIDHGLQSEIMDFKFTDLKNTPVKKFTVSSLQVSEIQSINNLGFVLFRVRAKRDNMNYICKYTFDKKINVEKLIS